MVGKDLKDFEDCRGVGVVCVVYGMNNAKCTTIKPHDVAVDVTI